MTKTRRQSTIPLVLTFILATALPLKNARAEESGGAALVMGGLLGFGLVNNDIGLRIPIGGTLGYRPRALSAVIGAYYMYVGLGTRSVELTPGGPKTDVERGSMTLWGAEASYLPSGELGGWLIGARLGVARDSQPALPTASHLSFGGRVGYDHMLNEAVSVGGEVGAMLVTTEPSLTLVSFLATAKLWF